MAIEEFFYATVIPFYCLGIALSILAPVIFWFFWKRMNPAILRKLFWAFRRRQPLLLLAHDSGRSILTTIQERQGEGIVLTAEGKYKILPRFAPKLPLNEMIRREAERLVAERAAAQPALPHNGGEEEDPQGQGEMQQEEATDEGTLPSLPLESAFTLDTLKENFILDYGDYTNKRSTLIGLDLPVFVGYTGKLCLLNPEALALYEAGDMMIRTNDMEMFNPNGQPNKSLIAAMQPLMLMNPRKIQEIIWKGFDQSQIAGVVADSEELERARMQGGISPKMKWIIILLALAGVGIAAVFFLPQILNGAKQVGTAGLSFLLGR